MKRIGCLTFHAAHNYGSCLQAYALKSVIESLSKDVSYEIINYRNPIQKNYYRSEFEKKDKKSVYSRLFLHGHKQDVQTKHELFEKFICNELNTGKEIHDLEELDSVSSSFDTIIVGSDQVWNTNAFEYSDAYFLPYHHTNAEFTYAVSIGSKDNILSDDLKQKIRSWILKYEMLSVRDQRTMDFIVQMAGDEIKKRIRFDCDPTLLLPREKWIEIIKTAEISIPRGKYILFYDLSRNKENWDMACQISKYLNMPIIITSVPFPRVIHKSLNKVIKRVYGVGPKEWLKLIYGAELVLSSSFHGTMFSLLLDKPFYSINTRLDNRVAFFLESVGLTNRIVDAQNVSAINQIPSVKEQTKSYKIIDEMKANSLAYLNSIVQL